MGGRGYRERETETSQTAYQLSCLSVEIIHFKVSADSVDSYHVFPTHTIIEIIICRARHIGTPSHGESGIALTKRLLTRPQCKQYTYTL